MKVLTKLELSREITHRLREKYPSLTLRMTEDVITQFLRSLEEKVLKEGATIRLRPYGIFTRKVRKTKKMKYPIEYVHLRAGKNLKREVKDEED